MTSRPQLCFSSRPRKAARPSRPTPWLTSGPDVMTNAPNPNTDQSVETSTQKGHTWKVDEFSFEILPWELPWNPHLWKTDKRRRTQCSFSLSLPTLSLSDFQLVCPKNFQNMQYLTIQSGALTSFPLDCQIKQWQQSTQQQPSGVNESKLYPFFGQVGKNIFFGMLQNFSN